MVGGTSAGSLPPAEDAQFSGVTWKAFLASCKAANISADEVTCWKGWTSIKINQAESNLAIIRPPKESANDGEATGVGKDSIAGVTSEYDWVKFLSTPATGSRISKMFRESSGSTIRLVGYSLSEDNTKIMAMAIQRHPKLVILEL